MRRYHVVVERNHEIFNTIFFAGSYNSRYIAILFWFQRRKKAYFGDCLRVLGGRWSWVGYRGRKGIFSPADLAPGASAELQERLMLRYMRHYKTTTDASILLHNLNNI